MNKNWCTQVSFWNKSIWINLKTKRKQNKFQDCMVVMFCVVPRLQLGIYYTKVNHTYNVLNHIGAEFALRRLKLSGWYNTAVSVAELPALQSDLRDAWLLTCLVSNDRRIVTPSRYLNFILWSSQFATIILPFHRRLWFISV